MQRIVLAALLGVLAFGAAVPSAYAGTLGSFEVDGNRIDDSGAGDPVDWASGPQNLVTFTDASTTGDDVYSAGTGINQTPWACSTGSAPAAGDISGGQAAFRQIGTDLFGYLTYQRKGVATDAHMDFEFNKSGEPASPSCPNLPKRTVGDMLVSLDQTGSQLAVRAFKWSGTTFTQVATAGNAEGALNIPPALTIAGRTNGDTGEAAINLTKTLGGIACGQFSGAYLRSRATSSIDSALQDYTRRQIIRPGHCPESAVTKSVRNATTNPSGSFGTTVDAKLGDTIDYTITYVNSRSGAATGVKITDTIQTGTTYVAGSCTSSCTVSGNTVTWNLGTVPGNSTRTLSFKVKVTGPFPGCATAMVRNEAKVTTVEEGTRTSNQTTVNVKTPCLGITKAADRTSTGAGDTINYTLSYRNTGAVAASGTTITETVPAGTSFVSCTGGCTVSNGTVTWSIGTLNPAATGSVTMTVKVNSVVDRCVICNVAKIASAAQNGGTAVSSNEVCIGARPTADPSTARASGDATGLRVYAPLLGIPLVNTTISRAASSRTGPGQAADDEQFGSVNIQLGATSIAKASVLRSTSSSQVTQTTGARQTTTSEVLGLSLLNGAVTADVLRSVASTTATGTGSSFSAAGTTATNLRVNGASVANAAPGTRIALPALAFGTGSYVAINEQTGTTGRPASGQLSGGRYTADLRVTAVRVHVTGGLVGGLLTLGGPPLEITVAKATAHSEHKQTPLCKTGPTQAVSGHALLASAQVDPLLPTSTVGFVQIPASGGSAHNGVTATVLPADGSIVSTTDAATDTTGTNGATSSTASSYAQVAGACVLRVVASPNCLIRATLIRSQANSSASALSRSSNATGTQFVDLVVAGKPIAGTPPPNTTIPLPGLGFVVLNEQVPDGFETGHTGLTVRAIHVVVNLPLAPLLRGAEVIVAEAHSDATYR